MPGTAQQLEGTPVAGTPRSVFAIARLFWVYRQEQSGEVHAASAAPAKSALAHLCIRASLFLDFCLTRCLLRHVWFALPRFCGAHSQLLLFELQTRLDTVQRGCKTGETWA